MAASRIRQWLGSIAALSGTPITLDNNGSAEIMLRSGGTVILEHDDESGVLLVSADLFRPSPEQRAHELEHAMKLNHLGLGTGGATLGWDASRDMLVLSVVWPFELLEETRFLSLLSGFVGLVNTFRDGLCDELPDTARVFDERFAPFALRA